MRSLTNILIGTSLIGNVLFNSCDKSKIEQSKQLENSQIYQESSPEDTAASSNWESSLGEDTLLKTAGNFYLKGEYDSAKENYSKFLEIKTSKNDSLGIAKGFQGLALIFDAQGDYNKAVKYNLNALNIYENLKDSFRISQTSNNLGIIFDNQKKYEKALEYYNKSIKIREKVNDSLGISQTLSNIANIFEKQKDFDKAFKNYFSSLEIANKINNKNQQAICYNNLAKILLEQEHLEKAFGYYQKSLIINQELGNKNNIALNLMNMGDIYRKKGEYGQALKNLNKALEVSDEVSPDLLKDIFQTFSQTYEANGDVDSALKYYKKFSELKDTLLNSENSRQTGELEAKYQNEKKELENISLKKDNELNETKIKQQKRNLWGLAGILGLTTALGLISYRAYRTNKRAKRIIEKQKKIVEEQKEIVEEKNQEITDSINYARNIQNSILPRDEEFKRLLPESFVLYKPKDIVSGDFYWLMERPEKNKIYLSASDCTGHGVPGGFMTMLNSRLLSEAVNEKQIEKPNEIFNYVRQNIINSLKSSSQIGEQKDGMDSVLCSLDKNSKTLEFACAHNPLYLIRNNELVEFKAEKMPVAYSDKLKDFTLNKIDLQKNDLIYIFSDGYGDQIGGPKEKKFMKKNLKQLLLSVHEKPMNEQKEILNKTIEDWISAGKTGQMDDILVIGVKI